MALTPESPTGTVRGPSHTATMFHSPAHSTVISMCLPPGVRGDRPKPWLQKMHKDWSKQVRGSHASCQYWVIHGHVT